MTASRRSAGFTLLEVLIAVAVMGMLLVLLNQGVGFGLKAATLQATQDARQGDLVAVDRALRQMIANAAPSKRPPDTNPATQPGTQPANLPATLIGTPTRMELVTEIPTPAGEQHVDAALFVQTGQLRMRWTPHRHVTRIGPPPPPQELTLLEGVRGMTIDYFGDAGWQGAWTKPALPTLIRLKLAFVYPKRHWPPLIAAPRREPPEP